MKKLCALVLLVAFVMSVAASQAFASDETAQTAVVDAGNKICPVMGGPVNGKDFVVYEGKRYGLCCPGCEKAFLADPGQYVAKVNAQKAADALASEKMERDMEQRNF
jgi:YHS domain-containing protein